MRQGVTATKGRGTGLVTSAWRPAASAVRALCSPGETAGETQYGGADQLCGPSETASMRDETDEASENAGSRAIVRMRPSPFFVHFIGKPPVKNYVYKRFGDLEMMQMHANHSFPL